MAAPGALTNVVSSFDGGTPTTGSVSGMGTGSGDRVALIALRGDITSELSVTTAGWTMLAAEVVGNVTLAFAYEAGSTDDSVAFSWTTGTSCAIIAGISPDTDFSTTPPAKGSSLTIASGNTHTVPSTSWTPTDTDVRIISVDACEDARRSPTGYPDADNNTNTGNSGTFDAELSIATAGYTASSPQSPGDFTWSGAIGAGTQSFVLFEAASGTQNITPAAETVNVTPGTLSIASTQAITPAAETVTVTPGSVTVTRLPLGLTAADVVAIYDGRTLPGSVNDTITTWSDGSGNARDITGGPGASDPPTITETYFGGLRAALFDAGAATIQRAEYDEGSTITSGDLAFIMVLHVVSFFGVTDVYLSAPSGGLGSTYKHVIGLDNSGADWVIMSGDGTPSAHLRFGTPASNTPYVFALLVQDAGNEKVWINGGAELDGASGSNDLRGWGLGGREDNTRPGDVAIGYLVVIDAASVTEAELLQASDDLAAQFGIGTSVLPAAVTVTATAGSLTITTGVVDITPAAVTVTATPGTLTITTTVNVTPAALTVTASPGTLTVAAGAAVITPAPVTVTATPGSLTVAAGAVDITPAATTVTATPGTLTITFSQAITPAALTVTATPGSLSVAPGAVDITPAATMVTATPGTLTVNVGGAGQAITPSPVTVTISAGTLTLAPGAVNVTPDPVTVTATAGSLIVTQGIAVLPAAVTVTATAGTLTITTGAVDVTPAATTVTATPGSLTITTAYDITLTAVTVTATAGTVTVAPGAAPVVPASVTVTITPGTVTIDGGTLPDWVHFESSIVRETGVSSGANGTIGSETGMTRKPGLEHSRANG